MSIQAVAWALEQEIPRGPKLVLVSLANHADHTDGYCFLRMDTIAREAACTPRGAYNFIGDLIRNGYVRKRPRKGDDGKQRANDYWLLFARPTAEWIKVRTEEIADEIVDDAPIDTAPSTTSGEPHEHHACGEDATPEALAAVELPAHSSGPHESGFRRKSLEEPSESNPKEKADGPDFSAPPRSYKPPPLAPEVPQGALHPDASKPIFVFVGTRAWNAWVKYKHPPTLFTTTYIDGQKRTGWSFPTLFPPGSETEKESAEVGTGTDPPYKKTA